MMSQAPAKKRKTVKILALEDFHLGDVHLQPLIKSSKCSLVPLVETQDKKSSVLVQLSGGGKIPVSFGIDDKEIEGRRKVQIAIQIDSDSDHAHLQRLRTELIAVASTHWPSWYPETKVPSDEVLETLCATFVSARKPKKNDSTDCWSGVSKAVLDPEDCKTGRCKIVDRETNESLPFESVPGMLWHKAIFELRYVYIQATRSYGITKKLRYLSCSEADDFGDIVPI